MSSSDCEIITDEFRRVIAFDSKVETIADCTFSGLGKSASYMTARTPLLGTELAVTGAQTP